MKRNIKFDNSIYENDIKNLNSMLDELIKSRTMKRAYKNYLKYQEKEISCFNCVEKSTYNNKEKFGFNINKGQSVINSNPVNLKVKSNQNVLETDCRFGKGFC